MAFWLAGGFIKSGLGKRVAYGFVSAFGSTTLGLTYSLVFAEALLSPAVPSVTARAGGCVGGWVGGRPSNSLNTGTKMALPLPSFGVSYFTAHASGGGPETLFWTTLCGHRIISYTT